MKAFAKILSVALAIQFTLAAGEKGTGDTLVSRAFTVTSNTDSLIARAFTVTSNTDSLVARAFTVTSNTDSLVSRAFTAVNCEEGAGGLCADCNSNDIPDECELDCGADGGPCDIAGCGMSDDCNSNGIPDDCDIDPMDPDGNEQVSDDCNENAIPDECDPDCDDDGIPDECEIAGCTGEPECSDCNGNGVPDECDPDCDQDGNPDECEISECAGAPECDDCNGNGIPDECDLDPLDPDGDGEVSGDCNENGIPDECDIADCPPGDAFCGDCNVNEIPDGCDVDPLDPDGNGQVSLDLDLDGVPDECVEWDGESKENDLWSTAVNWEDDVVPGVVDPATLESVVIAGAGANVILDVNADIDSLLLDSDTSLHVTDGDLLVLDPTDTFEGNVLVRGDLQIGDGHSISAAGEVTIGPGGICHAEDPNDLLLNATLEAGSITVQGGSLEQGGGGSLILSGLMGAVVQGDLHMQTSDEDDDKGCDAPPDLNITDSAELNVQGDLILTGRACVRHDSSMAVLLQGDFDNFSTDPDIFEWFDVEGSGELQMNGTIQTIEAAGEDRGPWPIGLEDNFALKTLTLDAGTIVEVVDTFDNQQDGVIACDEALYVGTLNVGPGAVLLTDGCRVYYNELINEGAVPDLGIHVLEIGGSIPADLNCNGKVDAFDLALLLGSWAPCPKPCTPGSPPDTCPAHSSGDPTEACPADLSGDCDVEAFDLAILLGSWGPAPQ
ncbi:MAG: hypothetical protein IIA66_11615 [Planctomycetes bacterium]|nr:hypothetical protein [Planctomycetota bacterium]